MPHLQYWQVHLIVCNMTNQNLFVDSLSDRAVRYWTKSQCSAFKPKCACNKSHLWYRGYEWSLIGKMESLGGHFFFFPHTRMHKAAIFQAAHLRPTSTFLGAPPNHYGIVMYTIDPEKQLWVIIYDHIFLCVCVCEKWLRGCRGESFSRRVGLVLMTVLCLCLLRAWLFEQHFTLEVCTRGSRDVRLRGGYPHEAFSTAQWKKETYWQSAADSTQWVASKVEDKFACAGVQLVTHCLAGVMAPSSNLECWRSDELSAIFEILQ